jgi:hypothetical protein
MFDLEQAIADWRKQMLSAGIKTPVPLEELEIHLREEVGQQIKSGSNEPTAFALAVGKIGQAFALKQEFKKAGMAGPAQLRKRAGFVFAGILALYSLALTWLLLTKDVAFRERFSGLASVVTMLLSVYVAWKILPRFFPVIASKTVQSAIGIIGGITGAIWFLAFAYFILPRCDFTLEQLRVAVYWAIVPVLALPTVAFLVVDNSEPQRFTMTRS